MGRMYGGCALATYGALLVVLNVGSSWPDAILGVVLLSVGVRLIMRARRAARAHTPSGRLPRRGASAPIGPGTPRPSVGPAPAPTAADPHQPAPTPATSAGARTSGMPAQVLIGIATGVGTAVVTKALGLA